MDFVKLLNIGDVEDLEISAGGIRALCRPDIAPLAHEAIIISSAYERLNEDGVPDFLDGANQNFFEILYRSCNGLHIGATKFHVFGFIAGDQSVGIPWDIGIPNFETRNERPKGTLVVGISTETKSSGVRVKYYHTIQSDPEIVVAPCDDFSVALRSYCSVEEWLRSEVRRALNDRGNW